MSTGWVLFSYQWARSADGGATWASIAGATASTLTLGSADVGTLIRVSVGYTDGQGTAESLTSAGVGPVGNVNDAPTGSVVISRQRDRRPDPDCRSQQHRRSPMGWAPSATSGSARAMAARPGRTWGNSSSYTLGDADVGALVRVDVTYVDGQAQPRA